MATQTTADASPALSQQQLEINEFLESSFHSVADQFDDGVSIPKVAFTDISTAQVEGLQVWKHYLQSATGAKLQLTVNALDNTVSIIPVGPMATVDNTSHHGGIAVADQTSAAIGEDIGSPSAIDNPEHAPSKVKVPRPPNAFIIYRREWHPKVVGKKPAMHNNDVSVIIGRMWKAEPDAVKDQYKRMAADAKRQHAIDHPGYQYQPRKPSEKKKRMTKTKLAKLKAQAQSNITPHHMEPLHEILATAANERPMHFNSFVTPDQPGSTVLHPSADLAGAFEFTTSLDTAGIVNDQLDFYNWEVHANTALNNEPPVSFGLPSNPMWSPTDDFTITFPGMMQHTLASNITNNVATQPVNTTSEVGRSDDLDFSDYVDFGGESS